MLANYLDLSLSTHKFLTGCHYLLKRLDIAGLQAFQVSFCECRKVGIIELAWVLDKKTAARRKLRPHDININLMPLV